MVTVTVVEALPPPRAAGRLAVMRVDPTALASTSNSVELSPGGISTLGVTVAMLESAETIDGRVRGLQGVHEDPEEHRAALCRAPGSGVIVSVAPARR
jgi:hypothetical protein